MMEKLITVQRTSQGRKDTQGISLQGDYLKKHGFEIGDFVKVVISKNGDEKPRFIYDDRGTRFDRLNAENGLKSGLKVASLL